MKCEYCGKYMDESERFCSSCGHLNPNYNPNQNMYNQYPNYPGNPNGPYQQNNYYPPVEKESDTLGLIALLFSIFGGTGGLIIAIIGLCTYKDKNKKGRKYCKTALWINLGWLIAAIILTIILFILEFA